MEILANRLRLLRKEKNLRQADAAAKLQVALITYQRYEANEREPNAPTIVAMARYFGVSTDYLLGCTDVRTLPPCRDEEITP